MSKQPEPAIIIATACGGQLCHDGQPHDDLGSYTSEDKRTWSRVCSRCGSAAIDRDLLMLP